MVNVQVTIKNNIFSQLGGFLPQFFLVRGSQLSACLLSAAAPVPIG
jgi:hypothetical protein